MLISWVGAVLLAAAQPNHCRKGEIPVFSCIAKNGGKIASLCSSASIVSYRFGKLGKVELEVPKDRVPAKDVFAYQDVPIFSHFGGGHDRYLTFVNGDIEYELNEAVTSMLNEQTGKYVDFDPQYCRYATAEVTFLP